MGHRRMSASPLAAVLPMIALGLAADAAAQTSGPSAADIQRVHEALDRPATMNPPLAPPHFYATTWGPQATLADILRRYDFINGPTSGGDPMSRDEFQNRIAPHGTTPVAGVAFDPVVIKNQIQGIIAHERETHSRGLTQRPLRRLPAPREADTRSEGWPGLPPDGFDSRTQRRPTGEGDPRAATRDPAETTFPVLRLVDRNISAIPRGRRKDFSYRASLEDETAV